MRGFKNVEIGKAFEVPPIDLGHPYADFGLGIVGYRPSLFQIKSVHCYGGVYAQTWPPDLVRPAEVNWPLGSPDLLEGSFLQIQLRIFNVPESESSRFGARMIVRETDDPNEKVEISYNGLRQYEEFYTLKPFGPFVFFDTWVKDPTERISMTLFSKDKTIFKRIKFEVFEHPKNDSNPFRKSS